MLQVFLLKNGLFYFGQSLKLYCSFIVLEKSDNVFINPIYFEKWSNRKRDIIHQYFSKTMQEDFNLMIQILCCLNNQ